MCHWGGQTQDSFKCGANLCDAAEPSASHRQRNAPRHGWSAGCSPPIEGGESNACANNRITTLAHRFYNASRSQMNTSVYKACNRIWSSLHQQEAKGGHRAGTNVRQTMSALRWRSKWRQEASDHGRAEHAAQFHGAVSQNPRWITSTKIS